MEIQSKRKHKKRRTRRNLDELREKSRSGSKDNVNSRNENLLKMKNISNHVNNAQITSKRLTLALFNNSIRSETVTRPYSRIVHKSNSYVHNGKENIISVCSKQSLQLNKADSYSMSTYENKELAFSRSNDQIELKKNSGNINKLNNTQSSVAMANPIKYACDEEFLCEISSGEFNHKQEMLANNTTSSCSSSEVELGECIYEKFMNDLPNYVKEHFPVLAKDGVMNKNIAHLKEAYWKTDQQKTVSNNVRCINSKGIIHSSMNYEQSIIQNPRNYVQLGSTWQQTVRKKQTSSISSNSSSSLSQLGSDGSNIFIQDSPEYIYFPHKLNQ